MQQAEERSQKVLTAAIDVCKAELCSHSSLSNHSLRIVEQLLTVMVSGTGEPSLLWANPALALPLRIHAFSTLLHFLHSVSNHLSKFGLKQLDGKTKWNMTTFGAVISVLFDEHKLFSTNGEGAVEPLDVDTWEPKQEGKKLERPKLVQRKSSGSRGRHARVRSHARSDSDSLIFSSDAIFSSEILGERSPPRTVEMIQTTNFGSDADYSNISMTLPAGIIAALNPPETISTKPSFEEPALAWTEQNSNTASHFHDALAMSVEIEDPLQKFAGGLGLGKKNRKWMTLPSNALATIREDNDVGHNERGAQKAGVALRSNSPLTGMNTASPLDPELVRRGKKTKVKQFRVPKLKKNSPTPESSAPEPPAYDAPLESQQGKNTLVTDEEIESAGTAFLDVIGKNLGYKPKSAPGEEKHVGHSHHRKTLSRCSSIDWTLPADDFLLTSDQSLEIQSSLPSGTDQADAGKETSVSAEKKDAPPSMVLEMSSLKPETDNAKKLPSYLDRVLSLAKTDQTNGRWFPYVYEVLIFQWVAVLTEQRRHGDKRPRAEETTKAPDDYTLGANDGVAPLRDAVLRARGCAVACAPVLLEIIKKSLGTRLHDLVRQADNSLQSSPDTPPLIRLDGVILDTFEKLISMITDACIDSRNFDSREFQQVSIDVNDSIVRFLRDLFAFLDPECVHRLILVYFSRFVVKDGKHWQDRDSKIGLRCSWEICKLRLNAITAFIRFPDFVRVNSPQMGNLTSWPSNGRIARSFFDRSIESFFSLGMPGFATTDGPNANDGVKVPRLKPHWLAELVVDICLSGTEHAEHKIQHRASSLLHELFWSHSVEGKVAGSSPMVASMYVSFLLKVLNHISYLSSLQAKSQLRKDLLPCVVFVLQCAPIGILQSFWRKLSVAAQRKGSNEKYGSAPPTMEDPNGGKNAGDEANQEPHIFDMFSLLNIGLATFEYGGGEDTLDGEDRQEDDDQVAVWAKEYLPSIKEKAHDPSLRRSNMARRYQEEKKVVDDDNEPTYTSTKSRKWHSHDGSLVIINSCRYIVREMLAMTKPEKQHPPTTAVQLNRQTSFTEENTPFAFGPENSSSSRLQFSDADTVVFVRGASSVYLHSLSLRQSDIVITKTLTASVELVKIFGIKTFLEAVGETLQHWMRVVMMHCGARRANVRVQALEFLALVLRVTWDRFGSFFRIRQPLLAVQTEVMERIVAIATTRYYREQRQMMASIQYLSNDSAEAAVSMFWRTLDRLHHQSASQNTAFRSAVILLAQKMKKLYRAYIAAHALSILRRARSPLSPGGNAIDEKDESSEVAALNQSRRISVHRIITASAGYCKQFLGMQRPTTQKETVAHNEAVEDAFLDAADVFSPTELPSHRVAWLQKLADFHADRQKYAEEATCQFQIQLTFRQAARLHEMIWSSAPFLPWTDSVHIDGEGPAGEPDEYYDTDEFDDIVDDHAVGDSQYGRQIEKSNTFRRIFYRVANSVHMRTGDWEISGNKHLFYGVTLISEYGSSNPWMSLRELEERMIEAAEAAGDLYLKAGIAESSRAAWGLATSYYAVRYNYSKLAHAYRRLSMVVASHVPVVDTNEQALDFSHPIGRFYRVWFHGGAPDDLLGAEFVYRAPSSLKLQEFGSYLSKVIRSILPDNTPIDLVLDDGRTEQPNKWRSTQRRALGPTPLEPVKIKVTPLRPLLTKAHEIRGTPEWFLRYTESAFSPSGKSSQDSLLGAKSSRNEGFRQRRSQHRNANHSRSNSGSIFGSGGSHTRVSDEPSRPHDLSRQHMVSTAEGGGLVGADKFSFLQPIKRERNRASRDWFKSSGDFAEKSLRVTQLQVERTFPACVARQAVTRRSVFNQSPLEAGVDAVCTWCSVLFRTAVATNGMKVLGKQTEHGIGNAASKVVADCFHSSRVKEMGQTLLKKASNVAEETDGFDYAKLGDDEIRGLQVKLARGIVVFIEMLHLLISRNRDQLLAVVEARKGTAGRPHTVSGRPHTVSSRHSSTKDGSPSLRGFHSASPPTNNASTHLRSSSHPTNFSVPAPSKTLVASNSLPVHSSQEAPHQRKRGSSGSVSMSVNTALTSDKTDLAIAVQSELQRAFISLCKALYPNISTILASETPRWLKECTKDSYFSFYTYRQTSIPMADEVYFFNGDNFEPESDSASFQMTGSFVSSADPGLTGYNNGDSPGSSLVDGSSVVSRVSTRHSQHRQLKSSDNLSLSYHDV